MLFPKAWLSDCVTSRFMRFLCCALLDLFVHQIRQPSRLRNAFPSTLLGVGSVCGLSLAARYRVAACSSTLRRGLEKSVRHVGTIALLSLLSLPLGKENSLFHPWSLALRMHLILFVGWTVMTHLMKSHKRQQIATRLLLGKLRKQDFAGLLSSRASRVLGPISRHRVADILPHMKSVSCASRPGLLVGFLRILCIGLCTAQRFHTEEQDHTCRIGCPNEPDSLTHYN